MGWGLDYGAEQLRAYLDTVLWACGLMEGRIRLNRAKFRSRQKLRYTMDEHSTVRDLGGQGA